MSATTVGVVEALSAACVRCVTDPRRLDIEHASWLTDALAALAALPVLRWSHPDDGHTGYVLAWTIECEPDVFADRWTWAIYLDDVESKPSRRGRADSLDAAKRAAVAALRTGLGVAFVEVAA